MRFMAKRGVVAKISGDSCIVFGPGGTYARIPLPNPGIKVGAEVFYRNPLLSSPLKPMLLVASLLILFMSYYVMDQTLLPRQAVAYVTLDIDPSLEMAVDKNMRIIGVHCFNDSAMDLIKPLDLEGKELGSAVIEVINRAAAQDYIKPDQNNLMISTISSSQVSSAIDQETLCQVMEHSMTSCGYSGQVRIYKADERLHEAAKNKDLSTGKYIIYEQIIASGNDVGIEEVKLQTVGQLTGEYKLNLSPNHDEVTRGGMQANRGDADRDSKTIVTEDYSKNRGSVRSESGARGKDNNASRSYTARESREIQIIPGKTMTAAPGSAVGNYIKGSAGKKKAENPSADTRGPKDNNNKKK